MIHNTQNTKLAVLIDADNAPADCIDALLEEVAKYGTATVKRIYGDWSHGLAKWKAALLPHALIPVQQFAYTKGKNATDMALVIDAMDLLYSGNFDGFCLVSSDSDFTRLASRIRESGLTVYGFGEKKTPESFRKVCDKFVYIEIFRPQKNTKPPTHLPQKNKVAEHQSPKPEFDLTQLIKRAVKETADDLGWANLGPIGSYISKVSPDFDARLYGFGKLSDLIKSLDLFEHRTDNNQLQVRRKKNGKTQPENDTAAKTEPLSGSLHTEHTADNTPSNPISAAPENAPKKRGRKPKNATPNAEPTLSGSLQTENVTQQTPPSTAPISPDNTPKKQGRPPKNTVANSDASISGSVQVEQVGNASAQPEHSVSVPGSKPKKRQPFTKLIPIVQQSIDEHADAEGWAAASSVAKALNQQINVLEYGFADGRDIIHAIYEEWIETKKIGRGERIRNRKKFISK